MSKVISLIIPTYNMASLLPRCMDSILAAGVNDSIEAIVVNDGSKDNSLEIAREYEKKYPKCITVIDKPNGNYGSTINAALPVAKGKYVKILDSDDWVDSEAFNRFVSELDKFDTDIAVTHFNIIHDDGSRELSKYDVYGRNLYEYGQTYQLDDILADGKIRFLLMHGLTYRTEMLRENGYRQSEGISYTDTQWCAYPMYYARTITFFDITVYQYNLAREGQTMDMKVMVKNLDQLAEMTYGVFDFYENYDTDNLSEARRTFVGDYAKNRARLLAKSYLYDIPRTAFDTEAFDKVDARIRHFTTASGLGNIKIKPENKILPIDFYAYWERHHKRIPSYIEKFNRVTDTVVKRIYVSLFRKQN